MGIYLLNKNNVLPKKLIITAGVVFVGFSIFNIWTNLSNQRVMQGVSERDIPAIQLACASSRLFAGEGASDQQNLTQDVLIQTLKELSLLTNDAPHISQKIAQAKTEDQLNTEIENYLNFKENRIDQVTQLSNLAFFLGVFGAGLLTFLAFFIFYRYKKNLQRLEQVLVSLESEKIKNIQSSKMASLGEIAAGLAHEINNPLSVIMGRSEILLTALTSEGNLSENDVIKHVGKINEVALRISNIVNSIRRISRGGVNTTEDNVSIADLLLDVKNVINEKLVSNQINFDMSQVLKEHIARGDFGLISQVILNLINNSVDAISGLDDKRIWITAENSSDGKLSVYMNDSGPGIPEAFREKLFLPFHTTKEVGKGTGLGLSISKGIMEQMSGSLVYDDGYPNTCFKLTFVKGK